LNAAPEDRKAWLVGGGIASLAAAAYLLRSGRVSGRDICILEESAVLGGSLDAGGSPQRGYTMRGSRMFGAAYVLMYELLSVIPSLEDPSRSVTQDTMDFWTEAPWDDHARLVDRGRIADATDFGLDNRDRVDLIEMLVRPEDALGGRRIAECFRPHFFETNFWWMWASMFGFETWHSAVELRRYLLRFLRLFPHLPSMTIIQSTRYNGQDSIVRPLVRWLEQQGVRFDTGVQVTDLDLVPDGERLAVARLHTSSGGAAAHLDVAKHDLVIVTLGSMTADSTVGSMDEPAPPWRGAVSGAWALWKRLATKHPGFGRPEVFCDHVDRTQWVTFTVTQSNDRFVRRMERFSGSAEGAGGLVTLRSSPWGLTFHLYHPPAFAGAPPGTHVWWGYGLFAARLGEHVGKTMAECSGREILVELVAQLGWQDELEALLEGTICIPCLLPYTTSQFMPRSPGDRPPVVPPGTSNLAFVGQYCEIPDNVVYTVEYSVHGAALAVATLLGFPGMVPKAYQGLDHPNALVGAIKRILE
jgi:oleate hydratase